MIGVCVCKYGLKDSTIVVMVTIREFHGEKTTGINNVLWQFKYISSKIGYVLNIGVFKNFIKANFSEA